MIAELAPFEDRFWARVDKGGPVPSRETDPLITAPPTPCWLWLGSCNSQGQAQVSRDHRTTLAYRVSYELLVGPIPEGFHMDHLCRNRACVNPEHLEPVTASVNQRRGLNSVPGFRRKDSCKNGHPFEGDNIYLATGEVRRCHTCLKAYKREWARTKRARSTHG